jgi:hypothetical protein
MPRGLGKLVVLLFHLILKTILVSHVADAIAVSRGIRLSSSSRSPVSNSSHRIQLKSTKTKKSTNNKFERGLDDSKNRLTVLSVDPLLFVSTQPILSPNECNELCCYFESKEQPDSEKENGELEPPELLHRLQQTLDRMIARPIGEAPVQPRFLKYDPVVSTTDSIIREPSSLRFGGPSTLLPDGLHVDVNNGFLFRYLTVLVYLTTSNCSATTFPLAKPLKTKKYYQSKEDYSDDPDHRLYRASQRLLHKRIHHTRFDIQTHSKKTVRREQDLIETNNSMDLLDQAAWKLYQTDSELPSTDASIGIRVLPRQGYVTAFSGIDSHTGEPHARSWHGAEAGHDPKRVLTFFYEIPTGTFTSQAEFAQRVQERELAMLQRHWQNYS